jgi:lipopolysaccharide transport system ATP-binding protein|tara:strand:- start:850 stop:2142 length:1293 start_codon:yes stop_codon:yes gene_type:complete
MSKTVIEIEHLYKEYRLGLIGYGTLREDLQSWWARARGKEDPNSKLFSGNQSRHGTTEDHILALNDINLIVKQGERLGIIGKNGAGKTTLLKILSRIASPTKGTARINGRVACLIAVGTGFHRELTGRENIYLNGSILGLKKFEIDERFDEIVDFAGVEQFIDTPVKRYSSGMYVRLGFAVAAHLDPDVLIVDEVLAVGDAEFQKKAIDKMKDVSVGEGRTVLLVSHNMTSVENLCEKAIIIEKGRIEMEGKATSVISHYLHGSNQLLDLEGYRIKGEGETAKITDVRLDSDRKFFYSDEEITIFVTMKSKMDFNNVYLTGSIKDKMQKPIGLIVHKKPFMLKGGGKLTVSLTLNKNIGLVPDNYYLTFVLRVSRSATDNLPQKKLDTLIAIPLLRILGSKEFSHYIKFPRWKNSWGNHCYITDLEIDGN